MISAAQLRTGTAIRFDGQTYKVLAAEYHPGQGKMPGTTHTRLQNLSTRTFWEHAFRPELKLEEIPLEKQALEFLYADGNQFWFMNPQTFEQMAVARAIIGPEAEFLEAGITVTVEFVDGAPVSVVFPDAAELKVADTAPPAHQQQDSTFKTARLTNGIEIMVPQFVRTGDTIRVDLHTRRYMDRVRNDAKSAGARSGR